MPKFRTLNPVAEISKIDRLKVSHILFRTYVQSYDYKYTANFNQIRPIVLPWRDNKHNINRIIINNVVNMRVLHAKFKSNNCIISTH